MIVVRIRCNKQSMKWHTVALPYSHLPYSHIFPTVPTDHGLDQTPIKKPLYSHIWLIVTITKIFIQDYNKTPSIQSQVSCVDFNSAQINCNSIVRARQEINTVKIGNCLPRLIVVLPRLVAADCSCRGLSRLVLNCHGWFIIVVASSWLSRLVAAGF